MSQCVFAIKLGLNGMSIYAHEVTRNVGPQNQSVIIAALAQRKPWAQIARSAINLPLRMKRQKKEKR